MSNTTNTLYRDDDSLVFLETGATGDGQSGDSSTVSVETRATAIASAAPSELPAAVGRDRVVTALLRSEEVTPQQVLEAYAEWIRQGEKDALWRTLARHPKVNRDAVFAEAARIYAFAVEEVDPDTLDADFVRGVIEQFDRPDQDKLLALRLLPLCKEADPYRGGTKLIFAT